HDPAPKLSALSERPGVKPQARVERKSERLRKNFYEWLCLSLKVGPGYIDKSPVRRDEPCLDRGPKAVGESVGHEDQRRTTQIEVAGNGLRESTRPRKAP